MPDIEQRASKQWKYPFKKYKINILQIQIQPCLSGHRKTVSVILKGPECRFYTRIFNGGFANVIEYFHPS